VEAGMTFEPALDPGVFVGGVIVDDHVDLPVGRHQLIDSAQKLQPFLMAVPVVAHGNDLTFERIEGGKQRSRSVSLIVTIYDALHYILAAT
jgi:hypothetical protein